LSVAVLVFAASPIAGAVKRGLEPRLGVEGCVELQGLLVRRAAAWAADVAPGPAFLARSASGAEDFEGVEGFIQSGEDLVSRLRAAVAHVAERDRGPLLCVSVDLPSLGQHHAEAALADLADGCDVVFGPASDGGCYLLGLARPQLPDALVTALEGARRRELGARCLSLAQTGLRLGLLRGERELHTIADADALIADPVAPREVVEELGRG
jgi:glycosyltransferase A (GT-A) superfamily protein (DUF2064 family)